MARKRFIPFALLLVAAIGVVTWLAWPASTRITMENASRIRKGMTLAEVEAILGGPARDEIDGRNASGPGAVLRQIRVREFPFWRTGYGWNPRVFNTLPARGWLSTEASVTIWLDRDGRVVEVDAVPVESRTEFRVFFLEK